MADLNRIAGNLGNAYSRSLGLDDLNGISTSAPEILPVSSIWERPEFWALLNGRLGVGLANLAAGGAGNNGYAELQNNVTGLLVIVERVIIANPVDAQINLGMAPGFSSGGVDSAFHRDTRARGTSLQVGLGAKVHALNIAGVATPFWILPGNGDYRIDVVLEPGFVFQISNTDDNAISRFTVEWRERPLGPSEGGRL